MTFFNKKLFAVCLIIFGLSACSSTDEEDDGNSVAVLADVESQFDIEVLWDNSIGGVSDYYSRLTPLKAYDKLYSANRDGTAYAFNAENGNEIWQTDLSDILNERGFFDNKKVALVNGGPIAGINKVFYCTENGDIFALDAETGKLAWQNKVKGEIITAPALDSGILVVNTASGILKAFNASNGEEVWEIIQDVPALTLRGLSSPVIASGGVILGTATGEVSVYILESGQQGWTAQIGEPSGSTELERVVDVDSTPVVYGDKVYAISARGHLAAIELRTGRIVWKRQYSSYHQVSIVGNTIFFTDVKGHVYAIDRNSGLEKWSQLGLANRGVTGPVIDGDYVLVGDFEGYLHWIDLESGDIVARHYVDGSGIYTTPMVNDEVIYTQSRTGSLRVLKRLDGKMGFFQSVMQNIRVLF